MKVLISGGAGFVGSTIASMCLDNDITPVILDNLSTGRVEFVRDRIFYCGDIGDRKMVEKIFADHAEISVVLHCAALLVAPESVHQPLRYYQENVAKSLTFIESILGAGCSRLIFSSSAAIYQTSRNFAIDETSHVSPNTPYGWSKAMLEQIVRDCCAAYPLRAVSLRYHNLIGADPRLRTGPQRADTAHVLDKILEAASTRQPFSINGADWPTRDGTAIRDYVHVWDLARAHLQTIRRIDALADTPGAPRYLDIDLGSGQGTTVLELIAAVEAVLGRRIITRRAPRRPGDTAGCFTNSDRARSLLGWQPQLTLDHGVGDAWNWRSMRPRLLGGRSITGTPWMSGDGTRAAWAERADAEM
jgi:UDP-glucose 4-epimerase